MTSQRNACLSSQIGRATVQVTTLGQEFLRGAAGECLVEDFPMLGETVTLESLLSFLLTVFGAHNRNAHNRKK